MLQIYPTQKGRDDFSCKMYEKHFNPALKLKLWRKEIGAYLGIGPLAAQQVATGETPYYKRWVVTHRKRYMQSVLHPDNESKRGFKNLFITIKFCHFVIKPVEVPVYIKTEAVKRSNKMYTQYTSATNKAQLLVTSVNCDYGMWILTTINGEMAVAWKSLVSSKVTVM